MLERLDKLDCYSYYVQVSITPYDRDIETNMRPKDDIIRTVQKLSNCVESFDIEQYDTCIHGCRYCYANASPEKARLGFDGHDPKGTVITGRLLGDEKITVHK